MVDNVKVNSSSHFIEFIEFIVRPAQAWTVDEEAAVPSGQVDSTLLGFECFWLGFISGQTTRSFYNSFVRSSVIVVVVVFLALTRRPFAVVWYFTCCCQIWELELDSPARLAWAGFIYQFVSNFYGISLNGNHVIAIFSILIPGPPHQCCLVSPSPTTRNGTSVCFIVVGF